VLKTIDDERMYKAGLLRIVVRMKTEKRTFEACYKEIQQELRLDPDGFRKYVNAHMGEVVASVKTKGGRIYWEL